MPKLTNIDDEIERLGKAPPLVTSQYTARLPNGIALEVALSAKRTGENFSRELVRVVEEYVLCQRLGVTLQFDPDTRRQLDAAASAFGLDRESLVRRIVGENLARYLMQAVTVRAEREDSERTLLEVEHRRRQSQAAAAAAADENETPAAPVKPPKRPRT